jgi:geranylgeranyl diphosphate synthase, type II
MNYEARWEALREVTMKTALKSEMKRVLSTFEPYLRSVSVWDHWPRRLADASRYALFGGGKRVRPCLALLSAEAAGGHLEDALPWAAAVEMVHTYSLIHDDLPCMDDDDLRRGKPTCHRQFDEATAILAGDALLTEAFAMISRSAPNSAQSQDWVRLLAEASGGLGMVGGQVEDIAGVQDLTSLMSMQRKKTAALISASIVGGGVSAGVSPERMARLEMYGDALGMLFQITDDILDADQDAANHTNSFLHHMNIEEVHQQREIWSQRALESIKLLGPRARMLSQFVDYITHRSI